MAALQVVDLLEGVRVQHGSPFWILEIAEAVGAASATKGKFKFAENRRLFSIRLLTIAARKHHQRF